MLKIAHAQLSVLFKALAAQGALYVPCKKADKVNFAPWSEQAEVELNKVMTEQSAKDLLFPQVEDLMEFATSGKTLLLEQAPLPAKATIVFGVRACDARSFELLDKVFLAEPVDRFYEARRKALTVISLACGEPEETCFCTSLGLNPAAPSGDVVTWLVEDVLYWQPQTPKGEALTKQVEGLFATGTAEEEEQVAQQQAFISNIMQELPLGSFNLGQFMETQKAALATQGIAEPAQDEQVFAAVFNAPVWAELSKACLGCGTCTFVCPTCHCYDIRDTELKGKVERFRCWDSCMYSDFTKMAHGNPRKSQLERFRQRFLHKLVYFPANEGAYACVGCGRCLAKCPMSLNIVKVAKALVVKQDV